MVQIARDKSGRLVIGQDLERCPIYKSKKVSIDTPYGVMEQWVDDKTQPLDPKEWTGTKLLYPKNEDLFDDKIKCLTWDDEPVNL